jgi:menaquinone-specific isochorismate synthase
VNDEKDRREHDWVVRGLASALAPYADLGPTRAPTVLQLPQVQHLRTPIAGTLSRGSDAELLGALHPSPAVCGEPVAPAREFIREKEAFRRGWYAGPVGTVSASGACIAVAIRSALVVGKRLHVYAGAGWVEGSEADREWREVEAKSRTVLGLIS